MISLPKHQPRLLRVILTTTALVTALAISGCDRPNQALAYDQNTDDWQHYGGSLSSDQHSTLDQINHQNIHQLEQAWRYQLPAMPVLDTEGKTTEQNDTRFQAQPIVVDDTLYSCAITGYIIALNPLSGKEQWRYDVNQEAVEKQPLRCRSLAYWQQPNRQPTQPLQTCDHRIIFTTPSSQLTAVDARTGVRCASFGEAGQVDLNQGISGRDQASYQVKSIGVIANDLIIVGSTIDDNITIDAPSGVVRAFHAGDGSLAWAWTAVPPSQSNTPRRDRADYQSGTVNSWGPMSADEELGLVFIPTGNPSPDLYGGQRNGSDYYGSSVVALNLADGSVAWHFQTVYHDVWDYDVGAAPALFQHANIGSGRKGVAVSTKTGNVFLLDRQTGEPFYPIEQRPVPQNGVAGEILSATQPFATHPKPLHPEKPEAWGFTPFDEKDCAKKLAQYQWQGPFTPPSLEGTINFPGASGGINWGGAAIDSNNGILIVNQTFMPWVIKLIPRAEMAQYDISEYGFPNQLFEMKGTPYGALRHPLLSSLGGPCNKTPWGTITAVDLVSGDVLWQKPLGTTRDLAPWPLWLDVGTPNLGGVISTAGGVAFATGATDHFVRAFDVNTGEEIWQRRTNGAAMSVPMTYRLSQNGKQYVVFAITGNVDKEIPFELVAYALDE
ncbi:Quinoprotein glucose dehydrogenase [Sinobacterium norvegicum]|uniref:Quinoprotein glucose dehydrogenase n=1 Tax=Sinobacterium norvegicum TaxID=1641715 RepID=A0ABM9AHP7_9GAMM|nr:pyrroloquinoline quinone-dependent dehydrogenase [Sinobacterium norvegicum]CAH0992567.1 Quinoprotein glucose dehydrogenase [Sinobacterium norvegicum]